MDDYEEYSRMAKLMTKIHALKWKKIKAEWNENENITSSDYGKKPWKEDNKEKFISNLKFHYKQTSNLDVSMEEEDKAKEPLQNFSNKMNNNLPIDISQNWKYICKQQEADIFENRGRCIENKKSVKISGASLFGSNLDQNMKKPKNKKKKVRRI